MEFSYEELSTLFSQSENDSLKTFVNNVHFDSRKILPGGLFISMSGENENGAKYCSNAVENGAVAIVVSHSDKEVIEKQKLSVPIFYVEDTLKAFGELGKYARSKFSGQVIGVIGSAGKTTTKSLLRSAGGEKTHANKASFNNETGVPLTICAIEEGTKRAIIELGESHYGDLDYIASIAKPEILVITNVGNAHVEFLGGIEGVPKTLNEAVVLMEEDSFIVMPSDIKYREILLSGNKAKVVEVTEVDTLPEIIDDNIFYVSDVESNIDQTHSALFTYKGESAQCNIVLTGKHFVIDAALAVCASVIAGDQLSQATKNIESVQSEGHRMRIVRGNKVTLFDDCYNANADSMEACIDVLSSYAKTNNLFSVIVMGRMAELGDFSTDFHAQVIRHALEKKIGQIICVGPDMKAGAKQAGVLDDIVLFDTPALAAQNIAGFIKDDTVIAVKASRGPIAARPALLEVVESIETIITEEN